VEIPARAAWALSEPTQEPKSARAEGANALSAATTRPDKRNRFITSIIRDSRDSVEPRPKSPFHGGCWPSGRDRSSEPNMPIPRCRRPMANRPKRQQKGPACGRPFHTFTLKMWRVSPQGQAWPSHPACGDVQRLPRDPRSRGPSSPRSTALGSHPGSRRA
jgi:hypothetical protein